MGTIENIIETGLPYIISLLEVMGIFVVTWTAIKNFWRYLQNSFMKKNFELQTNIARGLATGLEFKMGAEIIKTFIIHNLEELAILGIVIIIRALLAFLVHWEMHLDEKAEKKALEEKE